MPGAWVPELLWGEKLSTKLSSWNTILNCFTSETLLLCQHVLFWGLFVTAASMPLTNIMLSGEGLK